MATSSDPAKVLDANGAVEAGIWSKILIAEQLQQITDDTKKKAYQSTKTDTVIGWTPSQNGKILLNYAFSSERNDVYFGKPTNGPLPNSALAGEDSGSIVLLLKSSATSNDASIKLRDVILPAFGFDSKAQPLFSGLLDTIEKSGSLSAKLKPPPNWVSEKDKLVEPLRLPQGLSVDNGMPVNSLWCSPTGADYVTAISVSYTVNLNLPSVSAWVKSQMNGLMPRDWATAKPADVLSATLTITKSGIYTAKPGAILPVDKGCSAISIFSAIKSFEMHFDFANDQMRALFISTEQGSMMSQITSAFSSQPADTKIIPDKGDPLLSIIKDIYPWYVAYTLNPDNEQRLGWRFGLLCTKTFGTGASEQKLVLAMSYDSSARVFIGRTLFSPDLGSVTQRKTYDWDPRLDPTRALKANGLFDKLLKNLDLLQLVGVSPNESPNVPTLEYAQATFLKGSVTSPTVFTLSGRSSMRPVDDPLIPFEWNDAAVDMAMSTAGNDLPSYSLIFSTSYLLTASNASPLLVLKPAIFRLSLNLNKSPKRTAWTIDAGANNVAIGLIKPLFTPSVQDSAVSLMGHIKLATLKITYQLAAKVTSSFECSGILLLGELELKLRYNYIWKGDTKSDWLFEADLREGSPGATVARIAESIVPGSAANLPSFLGAIPIDEAVSANAAPNCLLRFTFNMDQAQKRASLVTVFLQIGGISLTFLQYQTRTKAGVKGVLKSLLRVSVTQVAEQNKIPAIGLVRQPLEDVVSRGIQDNSSILKAPVDPIRLGLTPEELNDVVSSALFPLVVPVFQLGKEGSQTRIQQTPSVLREGWLQLIRSSL